MTGQAFLFVGVSTTQSAVVPVFSKWCSVLGESWRLEHHDLPVSSPPEAFAAVLGRFRSNDVVGGLVTTHKAALFRHCLADFDLLEPLSALLGEVGVVYKRDGSLCGGVSDVAAGGVILDRLLSESSWRQGDRGVVILGAGGAGTALAWNLVQRRVSARRVWLVESDPNRHGEVMALLSRWPPNDVQLILAEHVSLADAVVRQAGRQPLVVNATGMGKDRAGSPLSQPLPNGAVVWEFNYRGELAFLREARQQWNADTLTLEDGWEYFYAGWSVVASRVAGVQWAPDIARQFSNLAG